MPEMMALATSGADPEMGRWFPVMGAVGADGGASPDDAIVPNQSLLEGTKPATYGAFRIFAEKASDMETVNHYSGAPINVEGQCVGTFCLMDGKHRDDVDTEKLRAYAARAAKLIEEKAAKRGFGAPPREEWGWRVVRVFFHFSVSCHQVTQPPSDTLVSLCCRCCISSPKIILFAHAFQMSRNFAAVVKKSSTTIRGRESSAPRWKRVTLASLVLPW